MVSAVQRVLTRRFTKEKFQMLIRRILMRKIQTEEW
ncbi:hypothetical protein DAI22_01g227001 [Oryza sativa Japonica Group]|nr:hypothetical protein DAI22_01g227001 [Oryza sativa Japonica Group]